MPKQSCEICRSIRCIRMARSARAACAWTSAAGTAWHAAPEVASRSAAVLPAWLKGVTWPASTCAEDVWPFIHTISSYPSPRCCISESRVRHRSALRISADASVRTTNVCVRTARLQEFSSYACVQTALFTRIARHPQPAHANAPPAVVAKNS